MGIRSAALGYGADSTRQKFTGKERDGETGLDYFVHRYYSSTQGRFTSPDEPLLDQWEADPQSWNLYTYVGNNPLKYTDPLGLWKEIAEGVWEWEKGDTWESLAKKINVSVDVLKSNFQNVTLGKGTILGVGDPSKLSQNSFQVTAPNPDIEELAEIQASSGRSGLLAAAAVTALADGPEPGPTDIIAAGILLYAMTRTTPPPHVILNENKDNKKKIAGLVAVAYEHLGKLQSHPPNDPNRDHWKKEIKAFLGRAKKLAERLVGRSKDEILKEIESIEQATKGQ